MDTPNAEETKGFWKTNKELFVSILIILTVMACLKYLLMKALEFHLA